MVDCFFEPDAPECQAGFGEETTQVGEETSDYYQMVLDDEEEFLDYYGQNPTMAKLAFIALASQGAIYTGLMAFRHAIAYNNENDVYKNGSAVVFDKFDWVMWAEYLFYYGSFGLFSLGWLTQLLDLFGVAGYFNFMTWGWALGMLGPLNYMVAFLFLYVAYEKTYNCMMDDDDANQVVCGAIYPKVWTAMKEWTMFEMIIWGMAPTK